MKTFAIVFYAKSQADTGNSIKIIEANNFDDVIDFSKNKLGIQFLDFVYPSEHQNLMFVCDDMGAYNLNYSANLVGSVLYGHANIYGDIIVATLDTFKRDVIFFTKEQTKEALLEILQALKNRNIDSEDFIFDDIAKCLEELDQ